MKNFVQKGDQLAIVATADTKSGDLVAIGSLFGFAVADALDGEILTISTRGVFETVVDAQTGDIAVGDIVYFDGVVLTTETDDGGDPATVYPRVGVAVSAAASSAEAVVDVKLG